MSCCRNHANELGSVNELLDEEEDKEPKLPILYSAQYNVRFCGLEKLHAFDAAKGNTILNVSCLRNYLNVHLIIFLHFRLSQMPNLLHIIIIFVLEKLRRMSYVSSTQNDI